MRIHTSFLTGLDISKAATLAGVTLTRDSEHGSRKRERAFDIILSGSSPRDQNFGGGYKAATWDEWGVFLGALFDVDPEATCWAYQSADHFNWATGSRFLTLLPRDEHHATHKWDYSGDSVTGSYGVHTCRKCPAVRRYLHHGTWADFVARNA